MKMILNKIWLIIFEVIFYKINKKLVDNLKILIINKKLFFATIVRKKLKTKKFKR